MLKPPPEMSDNATSSAAAVPTKAVNGVNGVDLSTAHLPPTFLPSRPDKPPTLSLPPTPSNSMPTHDHSHIPTGQLPPVTTASPTATHSPTLLHPRTRSGSVNQLPTTHQVLTPHSKPLTLTHPPTPTASAAAPSPGGQLLVAELGVQAPEDRFVGKALDATSATLADDLFRLLSVLYLPFFLQPASALSTLTAQSLVVTTVTGGITNTLYRVTLQDGLSCTLPAVLVRIFGLSTDQVIDRLTEARLVCDLSRSRAGVRIYGHFANGRLEEWLYATPLTPDTMTQHAAHIAATLATLHTQRLTWLADRASPLYTTLGQWMAAACGLTWDGENEVDKKRLVEEVGVDWWQAELDSTLALLRDSAWSEEALVFCHNDLLSGNILLQQKSATEDGTQIYFVDYEYSGNNYTAFDLANHFCECAGFQCDWSQLPTQQQRLTFIRAYLTKRRVLAAASDSGKAVNGGGDSADVESEAVELERRVRGFFVLSHLWWGIWAIVQAKYSTIDFDYLHYSLLRKQGYLMMKDESQRLLKESSKR